MIGYTFKVVQDLADRADKESIILTTMEQEMSLLNTALTFRCDDLDTIEKTVVAKVSRGENEDDEINDQYSMNYNSSSNSASLAAYSSNTSGANKSGRKTSSLGSISAGVDGTIYSEFQTKR